MQKSGKVSIVMYHYIRDLKNSRYPGIKGLDYDLFKNQIDFFKSKFNIIKVEELIAAYEESYDLPENAALLTFDDGYIDHFTNVYPVLVGAEVQGSFYIPGKTYAEHKLLDVNRIHFILASADITFIMKEIYVQLNYYRGSEYEYPTNEELFKQYGIANRFDSGEVIFVKRVLQTVLPEKLRNFISRNMFEKCVGVNEDIIARELYMNRDQIKCMKNHGMYIGLHGYDHYWLENLNKEELKVDVDKALEVMDEFIDLDAWVMNYPYGSYNDQVIETIKEKGCKLGFTTEVRVADVNADRKYAVMQSQG
ncbi:polysaccharide deacetylase family protein [Clostridium sp.]|uniref:polysaccharide deacetylase family protein n=1 Tax=Clostridium sp. TaxID=1506 RepID=UPI002FDCDEF5